MRDFDWNLIKSFLAVVEHETLSAAAAELKLSQPTLGRHITELEESSGLILFERGRNGMKPTDAALKLASRAQDMKRDADAIAMLAAAREENIAGTVRITASEIVSNFVLPKIITAFRQREPEIHVEIVSSNMVENLLARDADIAIRMTRPVQNDAIARKVADFHMGIYAHRDYLKDAPPLKRFEDIHRHTLIGYDRTTLIIDGMKAFGIDMKREDFAIRTDDQVANWHLLCAGAGVGFAPRYMANQNPDLVRLMEQIEIPSLPMWLVSHRELRTSLRIRRTADFLAESLSALPLG